MKSTRTWLGIVITGLIAVVSWYVSAGFSFPKGIHWHAERLVLFEGLPHQRFEKKLLEEEKRSKPIIEKGGYPFYSEPLELESEDAKVIADCLSQPTTYIPIKELSVNMCGGFHPDYAVMYRSSSNQYWALICFGCKEIKTIGIGQTSHHDLEFEACQSLWKVLSKYRKNRPEQKSGG